jgi:hypothetical protein
MDELAHRMSGQEKVSHLPQLVPLELISDMAIYQPLSRFARLGLLPVCR